MTVPWTSPRAALAALGALVASLIAACAAPPKAVEIGELPFEQAVAQASDALAAQAQSGPAILAKLQKKSVVLDPMLDAATGQQTAATALLETRVGERLAAKGDAFEVLPFTSANLTRAQLKAVGARPFLHGLSLWAIVAATTLGAVLWWA